MKIRMILMALAALLCLEVVAMMILESNSLKTKYSVI